MPIGKVCIYRLLFVCFFCVCTVTDFLAEGKASGVKFCTAVHRRPRQAGNLPFFLNFAPPEFQNRTNRPARGPRTPLQYITQVRSACVDIGQSPLTYLLLLLLLLLNVSVNKPIRRITGCVMQMECQRIPHSHTVCDRYSP